MGWLSRDGLSLLKALNIGDGGTPNTAILFDPPVVAPAVRHKVERSPRSGDTLPGLLLTVDDPATAAALFASWGVLRPVLVEDALHVETCVFGEDPAVAVAAG